MCCLFHVFADITRHRFNQLLFFYKTTNSANCSSCTFHGDHNLVVSVYTQCAAHRYLGTFAYSCRIVVRGTLFALWFLLYTPGRCRGPINADISEIFTGSHSTLLVPYLSNHMRVRKRCDSAWLVESTTTSISLAVWIYGRFPASHGSEGGGFAN